LGLAAAVTLGTGICTRFLGRTRLRFPYLTGRLAPSEYLRLSSQPGWSASSVAVAPGIRLQGLIRRPKSANAPWILFYPGNDATQLRRGQAFIALVAGERDWGLALYADRGYDSSDGTPHLRELAADAFEIFAQLCASERLPPAAVHVVGFSIGGHLAVRAVGAAAQRNLRPGSLSLLASVDDIVMVRPSFWARLDPGDDYQTRPFLAEVPGPVLVVQGSEDEALRGPGQGRAIAAALGDRAQYVELAGLGHNALLESDMAIARLQTFIEAAIASSGAPH